MKENIIKKNLNTCILEALPIFQEHLQTKTYTLKIPDGCPTWAEFGWDGAMR